MNNVSRQTGRAVLAAAGPLVWHIAANPSLRLRIERNSLDQDTTSESRWTCAQSRHLTRLKSAKVRKSVG
jgi:hypothetical protein